MGEVHIIGSMHPPISDMHGGVHGKAVAQPMACMSVGGRRSLHAEVWYGRWSIITLEGTDLPMMTGWPPRCSTALAAPLPIPLDPPKIRTYQVGGRSGGKGDDGSGFEIRSGRTTFFPASDREAIDETVALMSAKRESHIAVQQYRSHVEIKSNGTPEQIRQPWRSFRWSIYSIASITNPRPVRPHIILTSHQDGRQQLLGLPSLHLLDCMEVAQIINTSHHQGQEEGEAALEHMGNHQHQKLLQLEGLSCPRRHTRLAKDRGEADGISDGAMHAESEWFCIPPCWATQQVSDVSCLPKSPHLSVPFRFSSDFVLVEWDEKEELFKVALPHGRRFGKEFLAGLEVWATMVAQQQQQVMLVWRRRAVY